MVTLTYYVENNMTTDFILEALKGAFGKEIKIEREYIEMNWSKLEITVLERYAHIIEEEF